jgi:alpha-L-fucosidase
LDTIGNWINTNEEAIYASKPWKIYGDNLNGVMQKKNISDADLEANKKHESEDFNERTISSPAYPHNEVRFTTKGNTLYVFVLNPIAGDIEISSLAMKAIKTIKTVKLLGSTSKIVFKQDNDKTTLTIPANPNLVYTQVYKIEGAL